MSELRPYDDSRVANGAVSAHAAGVLDTDGKIRMPSAAYEAGYGIIQEDGIDGQGVAVTHDGITHYLAYDAHNPGDKLGIRDTSGRLGAVPAGKDTMMIALKPTSALGDIGLGFVSHGVMNKDIRIVEAAITENTTIAAAFPEAGTYLIHDIVIVETAGNAITGGLNIGTTDDGAEIVATQTVGANGEVLATLVKAVHVVSAAQTLYVHAETAWNSASINLYILAEKLD